MKGKQRCRILKQIRKEIADANGIDYVISECPHKGDCAGTCPKCESEVAYLERELEKRRQTGKKVAIAGIAAAAVISSAGCRKEGFRPGENGTGPDSFCCARGGGPEYGMKNRRKRCRYRR